jgi:hypothetical protein
MTPISAMRFSVGLSPVVSTSTMARGLDASKFALLRGGRLDGIIERTFSPVHTVNRHVLLQRQTWRTSLLFFSQRPYHLRRRVKPSLFNLDRRIAPGC